MPYFVYLEDIANNTDLRNRLLDAHMAHIGNYVEQIRLGGPIMRGGSDRQAGGILTVEADTEAAVKDMIEAGPCFKGGLCQDITIHPFRKILNQWASAQ